MADVYKFSEQVIDFAERLADVADAAKGRGNRRGRISSRWLVLPAAGAGIYAIATSDFLSRQARGVVDEAKTRASGLPDDLFSRVRETSRKESNSGGVQRQRRTNSGKTRQTASARKARSAG